jgi:hypothetical protein
VRLLAQILLLAVMAAALVTMAVVGVELTIHTIAHGFYPSDPEAVADRNRLTWWAAGALGLVAVAWVLVLALKR